ncbi:hypothetical protein BVC93_04130 [Mycobacterium sp. MS1601]|uniref:hypothetical protein n=1 Tax=Mycobacterium sp. MS1601 TaxID=1936029 RepID=UPI0009792195|nr:hypothetical protein [Mycobacterium sp. MS1601]AQA01759.1 hypothetical protein BVC93_04130 [Mycobacterium sp. MS1601]
MTTDTAETEVAAREKFRVRLGNWYFGLHPTVRVAVRWLIILVCAGVAFRHSILSLVHTTLVGGIGGYVWTVPVIAVMAAAAVARRYRSELPIHDRQTDMIVGIMGLVLAVLIQIVLVPRFATYFHLLRLDLVAMVLFLLSSSIVLFGLRPVARFALVWALMFMVFSLPYYLVVLIIGGGRGAAGAASLMISSFGTAIAVGNTRRRGVFGFFVSAAVGVGLLFALGTFWREAPMRVYQSVPAVGAFLLVVGVTFVLRIRKDGTPFTVINRKVEPLAAKQVWAGIPLVMAAAVFLALIPLPARAESSVIERAAPGELTFGQPVVAPSGWNTVARQNFRAVARFYSNDSVLVRQEMVADVGDPRFDKLSRPRTVMVDSIVSQRPSTFDVYPARAVYDMTGARTSPTHPVDLGHGVQGLILSVVDDNLLITWNALRFAWGDDQLAQRITIFAVDNHDPGAPFPQPSGSTVGTLRTLFTLLFRGNAVLDEQAPTFKDEELLTEFGRALVAAQFAPPGEAG